MHDKFVEDQQKSTVTKRKSAETNLYNRQDEMREIDDKLKSLEILIKNNLY